MEQKYHLESKQPNLMQKPVIHWEKTSRFIFCYDSPEEDAQPCTVIPRKDFEQWLRTDTDELIWSVGNVYDIKGYTLASADDFWNYPDYNQWRILQRLNEFNSLTLTIA